MTDIQGETCAEPSAGSVVLPFTIDSGSLEGLYANDDSIKEPQQPVGHV